MKRLACLALAAITLLVTAGDHRASESALVTPSVVAQASAPAVSGMVVEIDPATNLPITPTPETIRRLQEMQERMGGATFSRSSAGLVEEPSAVIGGGYMVDLQGRFQHTMTITIDASGTTHSTCTSTTEASRAAISGEVSSCVDH